MYHLQQCPHVCGLLLRQSSHPEEVVAPGYLTFPNCRCRAYATEGCLALFVIYGAPNSCCSYAVVYMRDGEGGIAVMRYGRRTDSEFEIAIVSDAQWTLGGCSIFIRSLKTCKCQAISRGEA